MNKQEGRIVFMGTPEFAVESLRALADGNYNVVGVVTAPDRAVGKHHSSLRPSPVKQFALDRGLPVLQPESMKDESFVKALRDLSPDLQIVVAFRLLPQVIWELPHLGTFNLHASMLPQYRGAAPINRAIMDGERMTGVTTFFLADGVDLGKIILRRPHPIADTDDAGMLHNALMKLGAELVIDTVDRIFSGDISSVSQDILCLSDTELRPAPKIYTDTCRIDWTLPLKRIYDHIRGLSPLPAAWTEIVFPDGVRQMLKVYGSEKIQAQHGHRTGMMLCNHRTGIDVAVEGGYIRLHTLQVSGKKRMSAQDFLNGYKLLAGAKVE